MSALSVCSMCLYCMCVCDQDQLHTFFSKSLHFFLALLEVKTEDLRRLLFLSNLLARLFTDGRSLNTTEWTSDSASWDTPTTPDEWAELERVREIEKVVGVKFYTCEMCEGVRMWRWEGGRRWRRERSYWQKDASFSVSVATPTRSPKHNIIIHTQIL